MNLSLLVPALLALGLGFAAAGQLIEVFRFQLEDDKFVLRVSMTEPQFGFAAGAQVESTIAGGIVMPVSLGQTVRFDLLRASGSGSSKPHCFTIADLSIDQCLDPGDSVANFAITFTTTGEFIIDDSSDPGAHGDAKFVVTAPTPVPGMSGSALGALAALLVGTFAWAVRHRLRATTA